jgi:hypothetical protein
MKVMFKNAVLVAAVAMSFALVGCGGGGGGGGYYDPGPGTYNPGPGTTPNPYPTSTPGPIARAWFDVYGLRCGSGNPAPGCNFYSDGSKIISSADPSYFSGHNLVFATWYYTDSYGAARQFRGYAWLSPSTGILYDEVGFALNELEDGMSGKDLIGDVAAIEEATIQEVGKAFAAKHALAEESGVQIARTLNDWATLGKKKARTDKDLADFSKRLFGVSLDSAKSALDIAKNGDLSRLEALNRQVAEKWGTNPETSREILLHWYTKQ